MLPAANDHSPPSRAPTAPVPVPTPAGEAPATPVPGSRLGTVPVALPGGLAASDESPDDARGMLGQWYGWPIEVGVLVLLASLFIWAMALEPVQELAPRPKARLAPAPLAAPARTPRA